MFPSCQVWLRLKWFSCIVKLCEVFLWIRLCCMSLNACDHEERCDSIVCSYCFVFHWPWFKGLLFVKKLNLCCSSGHLHHEKRMYCQHYLLLSCLFSFYFLASHWVIGNSHEHRWPQLKPSSWNLASIFSHWLAIMQSIHFVAIKWRLSEVDPQKKEVTIPKSCLAPTSAGLQ